MVPHRSSPPGQRLLCLGALLACASGLKATRRAGAGAWEFGKRYFGTVGCATYELAVRLAIDEFPHAHLRIGPKPKWDALERRWCRPIVHCTANLPGGITLDGDKVIFKPDPGALLESCGWGDFIFEGKIDKQGMKGDFHKGLIVPSWHETIHNDLENVRTAPLCQKTEANNDKFGHHLTCKHVELAPCPVTDGKPRAGLYEIETFSPMPPPSVEKLDRILEREEGERAMSAEYHPWLRYALGNETDRRAEVIYTSPTARAVQTAISAFGNEGIPIILDENLMQEHDQLVKANFKKVIEQSYGWGIINWTMNENLTLQYDVVFSRWNSTTWIIKGDRTLHHNTWIEEHDQQHVTHWKQKLYDRHERIIIAVGDKPLFGADNPAWSNPLKAPAPGTVHAKFLVDNYRFVDWNPECRGIDE